MVLATFGLIVFVVVSLFAEYARCTPAIAHKFCRWAFDVRTRFEAYARCTPQILAVGRLMCKHVLRSTPGVHSQSHTSSGAGPLVCELMCKHVLRSTPGVRPQSHATLAVGPLMREHVFEDVARMLPAKCC